MIVNSCNHLPISHSNGCPGHPEALQNARYSAAPVLFQASRTAVFAPRILLECSIGEGLASGTARGGGNWRFLKADCFQPDHATPKALINYPHLPA